jgi:predicted RNase H-like nuclease (RuvC/YqgF family)
MISLNNDDNELDQNNEMILLRSENGDITSMLEIKQDEVDELQARLEQALNGWAKEKQNSKHLVEKFKNMNSLCANLQKKYTIAEESIEALTARIDEYALLPSPVRQIYV